MTTRKQFEANRVNALGGGVKTDQGKAISSRNATKYGFFSEIVLKEDKIEHEDFCAELYSLFNPQNIYEDQLLEVMMTNMLAYRRICRIESMLLEEEFKDLSSREEMTIISLKRKPDYEKRFQKELMDELLKFQRYKTTCANLIMKTNKELKMGSF